MNLRQLIFAVGAAATLGGAAQTKVHWESLGNTLGADGRPCYTQRFTVSGYLDFSKLCFNQFARSMRTANPADTLTEIVPGYYAISSPRFAEARAAGTDSIIIDVVTAGSLRSICYRPDGVHTVLPDGTTRATGFTAANITARPELWRQPDGKDLMPYADDIFDRNAALTDTAWLSGQNSERLCDPYATIPSMKRVERREGSVKYSPEAVKTVTIAHENPEYFRITIDAASGITVEAPEAGQRLALRRLADIASRHPELPAAVIEDWPDFAYRGMHIDIPRNYQTPAQMHRLLDLLATYNFNVLHFHFSDDEAWRLEIPSLPELTEVGSRRGYTTTEADFLAQIFAGDGNPATSAGTANGYFTREDFIELLRHANRLGIAVLPEVEAPGHARAAIKAMEKRVRTTGDASWRLIDLQDTSKFTSAQAFHDNTLNPAMPGVMPFLRMVCEDIIAMYREADAPLMGIHIGGDEVPAGSWTGSPAAQQYMKEHGIAEARDLHGDFVRRAAAMIDSLGYKIVGWQEIALGHSPEYNAEVAPHVLGVNSWRPAGGSKRSVPQRIVDAGYPVILSNVDHFYIDMAYTYHPYDRGLTWGGTVDEFDALAGYPRQMCDDSASPGRILGLQGQLWAETIRSAEDQEELLLPKILGLAERAWNADSTYTDAQLNALIYTTEVPRWERDGFAYHVRMPGIKEINGLVHINTACGPEAETRYTLDGSEPTEESALYTAPFSTEAREIRARTYLHRRHSLTAILYR